MTSHWVRCCEMFPIVDKHIIWILNVQREDNIGAWKKEKKAVLSITVKSNHSQNLVNPLSVSKLTLLWCIYVILEAFDQRPKYTK